MNRTHIMFLFLFILGYFYISCDYGDLGSLSPVEGRIIFKVYEEHEKEDSEPKIVLSMITDKIYGCCNYSIEFDFSVEENVISINIRGIYKPNVCLTALGPAAAQKFLTIGEGGYLLRFISGSLVDTYNLLMTDSYIEVTKNVSYFTEFEFHLYWRYPLNSFVYLCGTTLETSWICEDFLETLLDGVELEEFLFPVVGEICYPRSSQGHYYDMPAKYFKYEKEDDFTKAGEILENYTHQVIDNYSGVSVYLMNWNKKYYRSWLFDKSTNARLKEKR